MPIFKVILLAIVQGLAELLPVSSSAHVVVTEKLLGLDPTSPQMTLLLVTHDNALAARCSRQIRVRSGEIAGDSREPSKPVAAFA